MKKLLKTLTIAVATTTIVLTLNSCGNRAISSTPSEVVISYFNAISNLDFDRLGNLIYIPKDAGFTMQEYFDDMSESFLLAGDWFKDGVSIQVLRENILDCGTMADVYVVIRHEEGRSITDIISLIKIDGQWKVIEE